MSTSFKLEKWVNTAVSGIRFGPDRRAVEAELREHIEDKMLDLQRVFPDIPEAEAQERALAGMGDPEELRVSLAKVHRPWLGYLWQLSRGLLCGAAAACLVVCLSKNDFHQSAGFPLWMDWSAHYSAPADCVPERAKVGGYTFQVVEAVWLEEREEYLLTLRASSPRFWARLNEEALDGLSVLCPDGTRWAVGQTAPETSGIQTVHLARWGLFRREFRIYVPAEDWEPGCWVVLELESGQGSVQLSAQVTEGVVEE